MATSDDTGRTTGEMAGRPGTLGESVVSYVTTNLATVAWSTFLFSGGLILLLYYAKENFWPDLDPDSAISLLAAVALTGAVYFVGLSAGLVAPAIFWTITVFREEAFKPLWYENGTLVNRRAVAWFCGTSIPILGAYLVTLLLGWRVRGFLISVAVAGAVAVVVILLFSRKYPLPLKKTPAGEGIAPSRGVFAIVAAGLFSWSWLVFPWLIVGTLAANRIREMSGVPAAVTAVLLLLLPLVINAAALLPPRRVTPVAWIACVGLAAFLLLLIGLEATSSLPNMAMRQLGLGNVEKATLIVNHQGCLILREAGRDLKCADKEGVYRFEDVRIISRLGATHYVSFRKGETEVKFTLPSSAVMSSSGRLPTSTPTPSPTPSPTVTHGAAADDANDTKTTPSATPGASP